MFLGQKPGFEPATGAAPPTDQILAVVTELLETGGYDAVQLRTVARLARVGLATIYKVFESRDDLILTALEQWMAANAYANLTLPADDESLYDGFMRQYRSVFGPWERNPRMLEAFYRARSGPGGERLHRQGEAAVAPFLRAVAAGADPAYAADMTAIMSAVTYGLLSQFAAGAIEITEILPTIERAVARLTSNNEPEATAARKGRTRRRPRR